MSEQGVWNPSAEPWEALQEASDRSRWVDLDDVAAQAAAEALSGMGWRLSPASVPVPEEPGGEFRQRIEDEIRQWWQLPKQPERDSAIAAYRHVLSMLPAPVPVEEPEPEMKPKDLGGGYTAYLPTENAPDWAKKAFGDDDDDVPAPAPEIKEPEVAPGEVRLIDGERWKATAVDSLRLVLEIEMPGIDVEDVAAYIAEHPGESVSAWDYFQEIEPQVGVFLNLAVEPATPSAHVGKIVAMRLSSTPSEGSEGGEG